VSGRGQVNYEGYHEGSGGLFVAWSALDAGEQARWDAGAARVEARFAVQLRDLLEMLWDTARPLVVSVAAAMNSALRRPDG
jgi:hypothetical protein